MTNPKNFHVIFAKRPGVNGEPQEDNFAYEECPFPEADLNEGHVLIRTCFMSVDPAMRCVMNEDSGVSYVKSWPVGETIQGGNGLGIVLKSNNPQLRAGDLVEVSAFGWPWVLYFVQDMRNNETFKKLDKSLFGARPSLALGSLVGLTALLGLWEKGNILPASNQTLVVSGAAGATGSLAGQIGRILGCSNVVGICGTQDKCSWLEDDLGFQGAVNYKKDDIASRLKELCPRGVDVYFDNVGGDISDIVIDQMNPSSHVVLCGQISQYNKDVPYPPPIPEKTERRLRENNITRERFLVLNYASRFEEAYKQFYSWIASGEIKYEETITEGLENAGKAFVSMMRGGNRGKQIVRVSESEL